MRTFWSWWVMLCLGLGLGPAVLRAAESRPFSLANGAVELTDVSDQVEVYFQAMRFNAAGGQWNFDLKLRNTAVQPLLGPVVVSIESFNRTTGPLEPDGRDLQGRAWYDVSSLVPSTGLTTGVLSAGRTLALGAATGVPQIQVRVFARTAMSGTALGFAMTLDEVGLPLPGVTVEERGSLGTATRSSDPRFGVVTLGQGAGTNLFRFFASGRMPVWRRETLSPGVVRVLTAPRLVPQNPRVWALGPLGGTVTNALGEIAITVPPGALPAAGEMRLTPLTAQTLPALLPQGWSPLQAFWLQSTQPFETGLSARLELWDQVKTAETVALVKWNENSAEWEVRRLASGQNSSVMVFSLEQPGAWAVVIPDPAPQAPPSAVEGSPLAGVVPTRLDPSTLRAAGRVVPKSSPASRNASEVTALGEVVVANAVGGLPSGTVLRGQVHERYELRDGTVRVTPVYATSWVGYQRPGDALSSTLHAKLPLRPQLRLDAADLVLGVVDLDVFPSTDFAGAVWGERGGAVTNQDIVVRLGPGHLTRPEAVQLAELNRAQFLSLVSSNLNVAAAFQLTVGSLTPETRLELEVAGLPSNARFVLGRVQVGDTGYGMQPVERLSSDAAGHLASMEPTAPPRLVGLDGAGQFVLVRATAPQVLLDGIARNDRGEPQEGLWIRTGDWLALSGPGGRFRSLVAVGESVLTVSDPITSATGVRPLSVPVGSETWSVDVATAGEAPRVIAVSPTAGAPNVALLSSISLTFSQTLNPGTVVGDAIELRDATNQHVPASVSLNLRGDKVTVLPTNPLAAGVKHTLKVAASVTDQAGRAVVGDREFTFTTEAARAPRDAATKIISHEPVSGLVRVVGSAGAAEPGRAVTLVNQTTGRTSTVLARPDGSFEGTVPGAVEDRIEISIANANGTVNTLPVLEQRFADGSVALFEAGGTLTAPTENGPMELSFEPGSLGARTKLKVTPIALNQVRTLVSNTPPEGGKILGGFRLAVESQGPLTQSPELSFPVRVEDMALPQGVQPTNATFGLMIVRSSSEGVVYELVDRLHYEDGKLVTHSPPFLGLFTSMLVASGLLSTELFVVPCLMVYGGSVVVTGSVMAAQVDTGGNPLPDTIQYLPGAVIQIRSPSGFPPALPGHLAAGSIFASANSEGKFTALAPVNPVDPYRALGLRATHPRFPGQVADRPMPELSANERVLTQNIITKFNLIFVLKPYEHRGLPAIQLSHAPEFPPATGSAQLTAVATDNDSRPTLELSVQTVFPLVPGRHVTDADVVIVPQATEDLDSRGLRQRFEITSRQPLGVVLKAHAVDADGNESVELHRILFGAVEPPLENDLPPADPNDRFGPTVVASSPTSGSRSLVPGQPIVLRFSEPVDRSLLGDPFAVNLFPDGGEVAMALSPDQLELTLSYGALQPDRDYTLSVGSGIRDLSGNALDQDPRTTQREPFTLRFTTAPVPVTRLPGILNGGGAVLKGSYAFVLDRRPGARSRCVLFDLANPQSPQSLGEILLPGYARDLVLLPGWTFKLRADGPTLTRDLLAVVGGDVGLGGLQYLQVFDVTDPRQVLDPASPGAARREAHLVGRLISADPTTAVTKVVWSPPRLGYLRAGTPDTVNTIDLQTLLLAENLSQEEFKLLPREGVPGLDANGDGDYVDAGDRLPVPERVPFDFSGKVGTYALPDTDQNLADFSMASGGDLIGVLVEPGHVIGTNGFPSTNGLPAAYRTLLADGLVLPRELASVEFTNAAPRRVLLVPRVPLLETNQIVVRDLALVSLRRSGFPGEAPGTVLTNGNSLAVLDITDRLAPRRLAEIPLPGDRDDEGNPAVSGVFSARLREDGRLMVATERDVLLLDLSRIEAPLTNGFGLHPAVVGRVARAGGATRSFDGLPGLAQIVADGKQAYAVQTPPELRIVSFTRPPFRPETLVDADRNVMAEVFSGLTEESALRLARANPVGNEILSSLTPPSDRVHYYVDVFAPGAAGAVLELSLESLNRAGYPLRPRGVLFPPVRAVSAAALTELRRPTRDCEPPTRTCKAYRLSADPTSPYYNRYLSEPFVLVFEELSPGRLEELRRGLERHLLWSGSYLRVGFDYTMRNNPVVGSFASRVDPVQGALVPGVTRLVRSLPADYLMGPNPGPVIGGVNVPAAMGALGAHNGEVKLMPVDLALPGRRLPIEFRRASASQALYDGPFGRGWDFNFNQRVVLVRKDLLPPNGAIPLVDRGDAQRNEVARAGDLLWFNGAGRTLLYREWGTNAPPEVREDPLVVELGWLRKVETYYTSPRGVFHLFVRMKDGRFARLDPDGKQTWYGPDGRLERLYDKYDLNFVQCVYNERGELTAILDELQRPLEIGYYRAPSDPALREGVDEPTTAVESAGRIARLRDFTGRDVRYYYDDSGMLERYEGPEVRTAVDGGFRGRQVIRYVRTDCSRPEQTAQTTVGMQSGDAAGTPLLAATEFGRAGRDSASGVQLAGRNVALKLSFTNSAAALAAGTGRAEIQGRDGTLTQYEFDTVGRPLTVKLSGSNQPVEETHFEYDENGLTKRIIYPEGNSEEFVYDSTNPSLRARANLLHLTKRPGPRGGPVLEAASTYDNRYNVPLTKSDYNGHVAGFTLDSRGRDAEAITLAGERETYHRNAWGVLESYTSADGITTSFRYQDDGSLSEQQVGDLVTRYEYAGQAGRLGLRSAMIDGRNVRTEYAYDERNQLIRTARVGEVVERAYDERGFEIRTATTVDTGVVKIEEHQYDTLGFMTTNVVANVEVHGVLTNLVTVYEPDEGSRIKRVTFPTGEVHEFAYDHAGRMTEHRVGEFVQSYTYDRNGNLTTNRLAEAFESTTYDGHNRPVVLRTPVGGLVERIFDGNGNVRDLKVRDPRDGLIFHGEYGVDDRNRYTSITRHGDDQDSTVQYVFETAQRKQIMIGADGASTETDYDETGRLQRIITPTRRLEMAYDANGNLTNKTSFEGTFVFQESSLFNERDQREATIDTLGQVSSMGLGLDGRVLTLTDRAHHTTTNHYNVLGELLTAQRPDGRTLSYQYDANREVSSLTYAPGRGVSHVYDTVGRRVATTNADGSVSTAGNFDARNAPRLERYPGDVVVVSSHDAEGRLATRDFTSPRGERHEEYTYDVLGRVRKVTDPSGSLEYRYDRLGYAREIRSQQLGELRVLQQRATAAGFRERVTYPSGLSVVSTRDATGRLRQLLPDHDAAVLNDQVFVADDLIGQRVLGTNVLRATVGYDGLRRVLGRRYERVRDGRALVDLRYAYDPSGAQVARQFLHRGGRTDFFGYDATYKLTRADYDVRPAVVGEPDRAFPGFEIPGAVTGAWRAGRWARAFEFTETEVLTNAVVINPDHLPVLPFAERYATPDATLFVPFLDGLARGRDASGNVTNAMLWVRLPGTEAPVGVLGHLRYNDLGQLVEIRRADGVEILNAYGPTGLRIRRTVTGPTDRCVPSDIEFVYDGANLIEMRDIGTEFALIARFYYADDADDLVAGELRDPQSGELRRHYFLSDAQRSVLAVTDGEGQVVERYRYDPWGGVAVEQPDAASPRIAQVRRQGEELWIEFSEPVLPALSGDGGGTNLVTAYRDVSLGLRLVSGEGAIAGTLAYVERGPGLGLGTTFRFTPSGPLPGALRLEVNAGVVVDEGNNPNLAESVVLNLGAGGVVFTGVPPGSTAKGLRGRSSLTAPFRFHGHVFDEDTGLIYCRARFYDPASGMYVQRDPGGFVDSVNLYAGFANNPINFRDPTGASVAKYALGDYGARLSELGSQASLPRDGMMAYLFGKTLEFAGAVLQLGTSTAEGLDRLDHLREGTLGLVDLAQAGSLISSDVAIAASAGGVMFGAFRYGVPRVADALPRYGRLAKAYSISGFDCVRDLVSQKLGLRTAAQIAADAGFAGREITAIHRNLLYHRAQAAEALMRIRMGYKSELWRKMRVFHVNNDTMQKGFAQKGKTGKTALTFEGGKVQVADLDSSVVYLNGKLSSVAEDNAFLMKGREFYEREFKRTHGPNSQANVPFQHNSQMQAVSQVGSAEQLGGAVVSDHALQYGDLSAIGHQGHTMTFRLDAKGNLLVYRTPGWMDDIDAIRTDFRAQSRLGELGQVTQFWALPASWRGWNAKYE